MPVDTHPRGRWQLWVLVAFVVTLATAIPTMVAPPSTTAAAGTILGEATLVDNASGLDRVVVKATGLSAPATGQVHRVWLVGDDGASGRYLGDVIPDATGAVAFTWDQPAGG